MHIFVGLCLYVSYFLNDMEVCRIGQTKTEEKEKKNLVIKNNKSKKKEHVSCRIKHLS